MVETQETLTFVVRLWREADATGHKQWRGRVEHVASQEVDYVQDAAGVARFIERWIEGPDAVRVATTGS